MDKAIFITDKQYKTLKRDSNISVSYPLKKNVSGEGVNLSLDVTAEEIPFQLFGMYDKDTATYKYKVLGGKYIRQSTTTATILDSGNYDVDSTDGIWSDILETFTTRYVYAEFSLAGTFERFNITPSFTLPRLMEKGKIKLLIGKLVKGGTTPNFTCTPTQYLTTGEILETWLNRPVAHPYKIWFREKADTDPVTYEYCVCNSFDCFDEEATDIYAGYAPVLSSGAVSYTSVPWMTWTDYTVAQKIVYRFALYGTPPSDSLGAGTGLISCSNSATVNYYEQDSSTPPTWARINVTIGSITSTTIPPTQNISTDLYIGDFGIFAPW